MAKLKTTRLLLAAAMFCLVAACGSLRPALPESPLPASAQRSLMRVTVTSQGYIFHRPWQQRRTATQAAIGAIVAGGRILVTGAMVADQRYIELETLDTQEKQAARVAVVDYEANLALLEPVDKSFLAGRTAFELAPDASLGELLTVWQVKPNGDVLSVESQLTSVELGIFSLDQFFLTYRLSSSLQYRFNNVTLPVVRKGALAGLVLRQNATGQSIEVISTPVIRHFLADAQDGDYAGFPTAGFHYGAATDPQLRRYIGLPDGQHGIYVQKVIKGGPADKSGLQAGDIILQIGDYPITKEGQFEDRLYGRSSLVHLIRSHYYVGDTLNLQVYRQGRTLPIEVVLDHRRPDQYLVPPYKYDQPPAYLIVGGLVIQELSVPYLREYGNEWASTAPIDLLYYQQNQDYLNGDQREKIVIISDIIPTPYSIGYENISNRVVTRVNGKSIGKLADVNRALASPLNGFHAIELQQHPKVIFLDPKELPLIHQMITQRYRIPIPPLAP
jgi:S1-C subfamily serine protease